MISIDIWIIVIVREECLSMICIPGFSCGFHLALALLGHDVFLLLFLSSSVISL